MRRAAHSWCLRRSRTYGVRGAMGYGDAYGHRYRCTAAAFPLSTVPPVLFPPAAGPRRGDEGGTAHCTQTPGPRPSPCPRPEGVKATCSSHGRERMREKGNEKRPTVHSPGCQHQKPSKLGIISQGHTQPTPNRTTPFHHYSLTLLLLPVVNLALVTKYREVGLHWATPAHNATPHCRRYICPLPSRHKTRSHATSHYLSRPTFLCPYPTFPLLLSLQQTFDLTLAVLHRATAAPLDTRHRHCATQGTSS